MSQRAISRVASEWGRLVTSLNEKSISSRSRESVFTITSVPFLEGFEGKPGESSEKPAVVVYDRRAEGYVRLDRSDLVLSSDAPGEVKVDWLNTSEDKPLLKSPPKLAVTLVSPGELCARTAL